MDTDFQISVPTRLTCKEYEAEKEFNHGNSIYLLVYNVNNTAYNTKYSTLLMDAETTRKYHAHACA